MIHGKRIIITGGAGFLGREVCKLLRDDDLIVPRSRDYDLRDAGVIRSLLRSSNPDMVIHLAAVVGGIGANQRNPGRYFYDNAVMGLHLIEECRRAGIEKFLSIGTVCSYPKFAPVPFRESSLWDGYPEETNAAYGLAKKMLLIQSQAYRQQYSMNAVHLLMVNLYGPGDNFGLETSHVIPALIRKVYEAQHSGEKHIEVWGTGNASREFLYAEDAARAIVRACEFYDSAEPLNIGSGFEISICNLVALICELMGFDGDIVWLSDKPDGQPRRCLDTSRATNEIGFAASVPLREGLERTIAWFKDRQR